MTDDKNYNELIKLKTFEERFNYLKTNSRIGEETFGRDRYLNQMLYASKEWKRVRNQVILRDDGKDLGIEDRTITDKVVIHHIVPITSDDILNRDKKVFDLNNLICVSDSTHKAIHFSDDSMIIKEYKPRYKNDTSPWRKDNE